jgi:hypothetical protein
MKFLLLLTAALFLARPAFAETPPRIVPCETISPDAVAAVPPPFDAYMKLVCYAPSGQSLQPPDGTHWTDGNSDFGLTAMDDRLGPNGQPRLARAWYTALTPRPISAANEAALRQVLAQAVQPPFFNGARIIELDAATSAGQVKQEFIITPADLAATHGIRVLMECHEFCQGDDKPWILGIVPDGR